MAAAAALAAPAAASAQSAYPTGTGLIAVTANGESATMWPDGSNFNDTFLSGTVGTFDGSGNNLSIHAGSTASIFSMNTGQVISNQPVGSPVSATAMTPSGSAMTSVAGGQLKALTGPFTWTDRDPAEGRFGAATQAGQERVVYVAGEGAVSGGGDPIQGQVVIREQDGTKWSAIPETVGAKNPTISPDGRLIAYEVDNGGTRDIYVADVSGGEVEPYRLADQIDAADEYLPTFSPSSQELVFVRAVDGNSEVRRIPVSAIGVSTLVYDFSIDGLESLAWQPSVKPTAGTLEIDTVEHPQVGTRVSWVGNANTGYKPMTDAITWQRCTDLPPESDPCTDIEETEDFTPTAADVGYRLRIKRVVENPAGTSTIYSDMTATVQGLPAGKPVFTRTPGALTNEEMPSFEWTAGTNGGTTYECRVVEYLVDWRPDTGWAPCTVPTQTPPLTNGEYLFMVRHTGADNAVAEHMFTVDQDPPAKPELVMQKVDGLSASVSFTSGSSEHVTFECRLDGIPEESASPWTPCPGAWSGKDLAEGKHKLDIRAIDKAGNRSEIVTATWTNKAPVVVEQPKPEQPQPEAPKPQAPAPQAETPAPAPAPVVEAPKPATVKVAPKAPALAVTIGGTKTGAQTQGGTSSAATIEVAKESVGVGCSITGTVLKSCKVDLYAPVAGGATARAAAAKEVLVGTGTYASKDGSSKMDVRIELNATGKALLRKNPAGLKVNVKITGNPVSGTPLKATGVAKLVTDRASLTVGGFAVNSAVLTPKAKQQLRAFAKFGKAATVRCVGHTDGSSDDGKYLRSLGAERAQVVCAYLAKHGVKATKRSLVSKADTVPAATNTTKAGRAQNRRVVVTLVR